MIVYTIKKNDTLSAIAYKHQTTISIIMGDNPSIKDKNKIYTGVKINIRTSEEYAKDKANSAKSSSSKGDSIVNSSSPPSTGVIKIPPIDWSGLTITEGQNGVVTILKNTKLYTIKPDQTLGVVRDLKVNERYRAFAMTDRFGGLYMIDVGYVKKSDSGYTAIPDAYKYGSVKTGDVTAERKNVPATKKVTSAKTPKDATVPQFESPGYRRMRLQVKKSDGNTLSMEIRAQLFNAGYSNHFNASRTNAGWAVHVGGKNLTALQVSGFLLDTKTNREADDFLINYNSNLTPKSSENYFSSALTTLLHKDREYKGVIQSLSITDQSDAPLDRKFNFQFMVLSEKSLGGSGITGIEGLTIGRASVNEVDFMSNLKNMLTNPITGKYNTHN